MPTRTTIVMDDELMEKLRLIASSRKTGLSRTISDLVQAGLQGQRAGRPKYRFAWKTSRGRMLPGVDIDDRDRLYDVMEGRD